MSDAPEPEHDEHAAHDDHEGHAHEHAPRAPRLILPEEHREMGVDLFNQVWTLLEAPDRSSTEDDEMVHAAHASRWHWSRAGQLGGPQQAAVGEWQCSRVYAVLGRGEPAVHHARASLAICDAAGLGDWVRAAALEAMARALRAAGDADAARELLAQARAALANVARDDDREVIENDLQQLEGAK
jgi:hypothetical protein